MKHNKRRRLHKSYRVLFVLAAVFAVLTLILLGTGSFVKNNAYRSFVNISAATDSDTRTASYLRAVNLCPEKPEAYILLLNVYGEDGVFTKAESESFLNLYNSNHLKIRTSNSAYAELHYRAGFLYANGYEETATTRLRMAIPFFEAAAEHIKEDDPNRLAVESYNMIGKYYQNYIWDASSVREVSAEEMIALTEEIYATIIAYQQNESADALFNRLGFSEAVCNLMYSQRDILAATVPYEKIQIILDAIYQGLPEQEDIQKEQIKQLLLSLESNKEMYTDMISRAYNRKGGVDNAG